MEPSAELIQELRTKFFQKLENDGAPDPGGFHPADLARVRTSDDWLRRFLMHHDCNVNEALEMLWDCIEWRKKFGANEISESNIRMDYIMEGSLFPYNRDKDGSSLLIFKSKKHVKGQKDLDELKKVVVYWFERLERLDKGKPISLFFDMSDAGMSNLDMEFIKYLIGLFTNYYPYFLSYIIIYDMPWILNAAFKIIKSWLPAKAVQKIKFLNKNNLKEYVDPDQALSCWGGNDDYVFTFVPEQFALPLDRNDDSRKKVHFADGSPMVEFPGSFSEGQTSKEVGQSSNSLLNIEPPDVINFATQGTEFTGTITLTNAAETAISYKIKTTSPEKFRVRPSTGILAPSKTVSINVVLQPGYQHPGLSRDKFLIMSLPVQSQDMSSQDVADLWKQTNGKTIEQHRLRCNVAGASGEGQLRNGTAFGSQLPVDTDKQIAQILSQVRQLNENHQSLHADLRWTQKLQWLTMFFVAMVGFVIIYSIGDSQPDSHESSCMLP